MQKRLISVIILLIFLALLVPNTVILNQTDVKAAYVEETPTECDITIKGGVGLKIIIVCDEEIAHSLNWSVNLDGFFIFAVSSGTSYEILPDEKTKIVAKFFLIGYMSITVQVLIDSEVVKEAEGLMIGFFVFLKEHKYEHK